MTMTQGLPEEDFSWIWIVPRPEGSSISLIEEGNFCVAGRASRAGTPAEAGVVTAKIKARRAARTLRAVMRKPPPNGRSGDLARSAGARYALPPPGPI